MHHGRYALLLVAAYLVGYGLVPAAPAPDAPVIAWECVNGPEGEYQLTADNVPLVTAKCHAPGRWWFSCLGRSETWHSLDGDAGKEAARFAGRCLDDARRELRRKE